MSSAHMTTTMDSPVGVLTLTAEAATLTGVYLPASPRAGAPGDPVESAAPSNAGVLAEAVRQLRAYFGGELTDFDLPMAAPTGTPFQRRVWDALSDIGYGTTASYAQLAAMIGAPSASRAVGRANGRNPLSILVPCHRVIGADGSLTGYGGGVPAKRYLLALEQRASSEQQASSASRPAGAALAR